MKILQIAFIIILCFSLLNLSEPAYAQVSTIQRDIATYQADWYGIEFTQQSNWTIFLSTSITFMKSLIDDDDII